MLNNGDCFLGGSPLCDFISKEWTKCANDLDSIEVEESDFLLYILWVIDTLRDYSNREQFLGDPWNNTRMAIRAHLRKKGFASGKEDVDLLTRTVCGHSLFCWSLVMTDDVNDADVNREAYMSFIHKLDSHWKEVGTIMDSLQYEHLPELRQWMTSYVAGDVFYTVSSEMDWDAESTGLLPTAASSALNQPTNVNIHIDTLNNMPGATFNDNSITVHPTGDITKQLK